jgi:hypothetical protein
MKTEEQIAARIEELRGRLKPRRMIHAAIDEGSQDILATLALDAFANEKVNSPG